MMKKLGFTLAEVLITLGIIGVVAAMTIPTLLSQTNSQEYKTAFKKAIASLNQAVTLNLALDGNDFSALSVASSTTDSNSVYYMFTTRMNVVSTGANSDMGAATFGATGNYTLFFNDGIAVTFPKTAASCTTEAAGCTMIVDVNGAKKPNMMSAATDTSKPIRDQYKLYFYDQQVVPADNSAKYLLFN